MCRGGGGGGRDDGYAFAQSEAAMEFPGAPWAKLLGTCLWKIQLQDPSGHADLLLASNTLSPRLAPELASRPGLGRLQEQMGKWMKHLALSWVPNRWISQSCQPSYLGTGQPQSLKELTEG